MNSFNHWAVLTSSDFIVKKVKNNTEWQVLIFQSAVRVWGEYVKAGRKVISYTLLCRTSPIIGLDSEKDSMFPREKHVNLTTQRKDEEQSANNLQKLWLFWWTFLRCLKFQGRWSKFKPQGLRLNTVAYRLFSSVNFNTSLIILIFFYRPRGAQDVYRPSFKWDWYQLLWCVCCCTSFFLLWLQN